MIRDFITNEMVFTYGDAIEAISPPSKGNEYYYECKKVDGIPQYEDYENIVWLDTNSDPKPSKEDVETKFAELVTKYSAQEYSRKRQTEYPSLQECLHAILDDDLDALQTKRAAVKAKYPKPS